MYKSLYSIISDMSGFVLAIGVDDKLVEKIDKNKNITNCDALNYVSNKNSKEKGKKLKKISIKNLRKIYKKKNVDYIICNYEHINKFLNTFVKDSVYINKTKLYFYGDIDKELILKKYQRYDTKIDIKDYKDTCIIEIDNTNSKNNKLKEIKYGIVDGFNHIIEVIGDILMG